MAVPVVLGGALAVLGRFVSKLWMPAALGVAGYALEQMTDGLTWAYVQLGMLAAKAAGAGVSTVDVPDAMATWSWAAFGADALRLIDFYQLDLAVGLVVSGALARVAVKVMTLGRY